jgi:hypothetical protein
MFSARDRRRHACDLGHSVLFRTSPFIEPLSAARAFHEMIGLGFGDAVRRRLAEVVVLSSRAA